MRRQSPFVFSLHQFAIGLRYAMNFPEPPIGPELKAFIQQAGVDQYVLHCESVAVNREWLAGQLFLQRRFDEAVCVLISAEEARSQAQLIAGTMLSQCDHVEV